MIRNKALLIVKEHKKLTHYSFFVGVFFVIVLLNIQFTGPIFLSDEIGYLNKAMILSGFQADLPSSYHGGYSILLAPLFLIFTTPSGVWFGVIMLNALLVTGSLFILFHLLQKLFPKKGYWSILGTVALCALYPSLVVLAGYAFATPAFVFFYLLSLWYVLKLDLTKYTTVVIPSITIGFLYWIHPLGIAPCIAWLLVLALFTWRRKRDLIPLSLATGVVALMVLLYQFGIHAWLNHAMLTSASDGMDHYAEATKALPSLFNLHSLAKVALLAIGQLAGVLIVSFGFVLVVWLQAAKSLKNIKIKRSRADNDNKPLGLKEISLFLTISMLGIVILGSINFYLAQQTTHPERADYWIYGRYADMVLLPFLGIGILLKKQIRYAVIAVCALLLVGVTLTALGVAQGAFNNTINTISFYPQYFYAQPNFFIWFLIGAAGICYTLFLKRWQYALLLLPLGVMAVFQQSHIKQAYLSDPEYHASGLTQVIRDNISTKECIGFEDKKVDPLSPYGKINLYMYYLYDYDFEKMSAEKWLSGGCEVYVTRDKTPFVDNAKSIIVGKEDKTNLYLVFKNDNSSDIKGKNMELEDFYFYQPTKNDTCVVKECFDRNAHELKSTSEVGVYRDGTIRSTGKEGYLFFGPYLPLNAGEYELTLDIDFKDSDKAELEILSGDNKEDAIYYKKAQIDNHNKKVKFTLNENILRAQIRLTVGSDTKVDFRYYTIR